MTMSRLENGSAFQCHSVSPVVERTACGCGLSADVCLLLVRRESFAILSRTRECLCVLHWRRLTAPPEFTVFYLTNTNQPYAEHIKHTQIIHNTYAAHIVVQKYAYHCGSTSDADDNDASYCDDDDDDEGGLLTPTLSSEFGFAAVYCCYTCSLLLLLLLLCSLCVCVCVLFILLPVSVCCCILTGAAENGTKGKAGVGRQKHRKHQSHHHRLLTQASSSIRVYRRRRPVFLRVLFFCELFRVHSERSHLPCAICRCLASVIYSHKCVFQVEQWMPNEPQQIPQQVVM